MNSIRRVSDLPQIFRDAFSFKLFNAVQSDCFEECFNTDVNMVVAAPTSSGKTVALELCMLRLLSRHLDPAGRWCLNKGQFKVVYVAPTKALIQERVNDWNKRFGGLQLSIAECTGDSAETTDLTQADVIATTPEKLDALSRRCFDTGSMRFVSDVALLLIDEVHAVSETRGPTLEAGVVCRLQALGSMPQMQGTNLHSLRIVAASATIPNVYDVARWIKAPEEGCKVFGEELRPVTIRTVVKAFPPGKNDFLFERNLSQKVFPILQEFWQQKPVIIFCSSRKGTVECCNKINDASKQIRVQTPSYFVRNPEQQARLREAAATVQDKGLAEVITRGLAWHNAAMSQEDRSLVEQLFISRDLMCIAATATLAQGVNLPAYLVIIKGTQRYCSEGGKGLSSYQEYEQGECLQMIGRAGRPQFESSATAVIMTKSDNRLRYQNLASGRKAVESHLHHCTAEFLNADIAQRIVTSVSQAHAWLQKSLFWAMHLFVDTPLRKLQESGIIEINGADGTITPKDPSSLMCKHCIQLATMIMINEAPSAASPRDLLEIVCKASENANVMLRRTEKKVLNDLNQTAAEQESNVPGSSYMVREAVDSVKRKQRLSEPWEKSFVLVNACLAAGGVNSPSIDYSMISDAARVIQNGLRIVNCMIRYFEFQRRFAAMTAAIRLHRALLQKMWDRYEATCRQVPGVGNVLVQRLVAAGIRSIQEFLAADPRQLELVTTKLYPWGDTKREDARRLLPPPCSVQVALLGGDRLPKVRVTVHCTAIGRGKAFCWLVVGCLNDDSLLISRYVDVASLVGPMELTAMLRGKLTGDLRIVAAILSDKVIGGDTVTPVTYTIAQQAAVRQSRPAKTPIDLTVPYSCTSGAQEGSTAPHKSGQDIQPQAPAAKQTTAHVPLSSTDHGRQSSVPPTDAGRAMPSTKQEAQACARGTAPQPRKRANWVLEAARALKNSELRPQERTSEPPNPVQNCATAPPQTAPLQLRSLAQRVQDAKRLPTQPLSILQSRSHAPIQGCQQQCEMPRPHPEPQHGVLAAPAEGAPPMQAAPPTCTSSPTSTKWQLTALYVPGSAAGTSAAPGIPSSSLPGPIEARKATHNSQYRVGAPSTASEVSNRPSTFEKTVNSTREISCHKAKNKLGGAATVGSLDSCSTPSNVSSQGIIGAAVPPRDEKRTATGSVNKAPGSSLPFSCASHAQPSPDSPQLKPGAIAQPCNTSGVSADQVMQTPALQATAALPSALPAATAAPPVNRRKALKQLIQRARQILAVDPKVDTHPPTTKNNYAAVGTSVAAQPCSSHLAANNTAQCNSKAAHLSPPPAGGLQGGIQTQHAHVHAMSDVISCAPVPAAVCAQSGATGAVRHPPNELRGDVMSSPTRDKNDLRAPYQQHDGDCEADLKFEDTVMPSQAQHAASIPHAGHETSTAQDAAAPCTGVPHGIWDQFVTRGKAQYKSSVSSEGLADAQLWTASPQSTSDMWSSMQHAPPSSLLPAPPKIVCHDTARAAVAPTGAWCLDERQRVPEARQPATATTQACTKEGTRTRSLIQGLLISRSQGGKGQAFGGGTSQRRVPLNQEVVKEALPQVSPGVPKAESDMRARLAPAPAPQPAHEPQLHLAAFEEQDIELSPDMLLNSASDRRTGTPPFGGTHTLAKPAMGSHDRAIHAPGAARAWRMNEVPCGASSSRSAAQYVLQGSKDTLVAQGGTESVPYGSGPCESSGLLSAEQVADEKESAAGIWSDLAQEKADEHQLVEHHSTATLPSGRKPSAVKAIRAVAHNFRQQPPPETGGTEEAEPGSQADLENSALAANGATVDGSKGAALQKPGQNASNGTKATEPLAEATENETRLQTELKQQGEAARGMHQLSCAAQEHSGPCMPGNVEAAACTESQGGVQPTPSSRPTIKLPALPLARKFGGSVAQLGRTGDAAHCEEVEEKSSKPLQAAAAVAVKRRLGGGAPAAQVAQNPATDSKGLKRAFKVPRSK